ncbi:MAG: hypothetical protein K1W34_10350 [Lachnospiraceae bacterium]
MEKQKKETKKIYFESVSLFKELVEGNQLKNLRSVKSKVYPQYCFLATKKVKDIFTEFLINHDMKCDRTADETWGEFEKTVVNAETKPDTIVTRNLRVVKRAVSEGYGDRLKRTCVDQHGKKAFIFYANNRINEIKQEEDAKSLERYEQKSKATVCMNQENKKKTDTKISELIKKAMEVQK